MQDPNFKQLFIDTLQTLRRGVLSNAGFAARVDALAAGLSDHGAADSPQKRNFIKWSTLGSVATGFQAFPPAGVVSAGTPVVFRGTVPVGSQAHGFARLSVGKQ